MIITISKKSNISLCLVSFIKKILMALLMFLISFSNILSCVQVEFKSRKNYSAFFHLSLQLCHPKHFITHNLRTFYLPNGLLWRQSYKIYIVLKKTKLVLNSLMGCYFNFQFRLNFCCVVI